MNLLSNISQNFTYLKNDFIGISINFSGVMEVFLNIIFSILALAAYYVIGEKLSQFLIDVSLNKYKHFVFIAIGYVVSGTLIALFGLFSLLYPPILSMFAIIFLVCGVYFFVKKLKYIGRLFNQALIIFQSKPVLYSMVLIFVLIIAFRLLIPETAEDDYHTDLPNLYLFSKTTMLSIIHMQHVITYPQLAEMHYLLAIFLGLNDATRYLHFLFFLLTLCLLIELGEKKQNLFQYSPLLFVTTPLVIKYAPTSYTDFFMLFCFLLSAIILFSSSRTYRAIIISGIILGGAFSIKLWTLIFLPLYFLFIFNYFKRKKDLLLRLSTLILFSIAPPLIWYIRSYILKGNPFYPVFSKPYDVAETLKNVPTLSSYFNINWRMLSFDNIVLFSPLFFLGIILLIFHLKLVIPTIKKSQIVIFFILLFVEHLVLNIAVSRYLLAWYVFAILISSIGFMYLRKSRIAVFAFFSLFFILLFYYGSNTLINLTYAFNWADQNKYLTRILSRDNSSYYDFDRLFDNKIDKNDLVATYGIFGFYYADFKYIDINNVFVTKPRSFDNLTKSNASKLLIKGGDFMWFCNTLRIEGCDEKKVKLLATFPKETRKYNLYKIIENNIVEK